MTESDRPDNAVAVVGLALRVPGASDPGTFWANIVAGRVSLPAAREDRADPVDGPLVAGQIDRYERFDAELFGMTHAQAATTDPQHRVLTELTWEALEDAGLDTERDDGRVGVFVGCGPDDYLHHHVLRDDRVVRTQGTEQILFGNSRDYLATALSYRLGLTGPSMTVQTACSTSLVAVHQAVRSLLTYECDIAVAGGVTVFPVERPEYRWSEGGIYAPDGRCRAFTRGSGGTVPSGGAGVVVLRRSADLPQRGRTARAHIVGSAVNNDGADRMAMSAPSPRGQAEVIREALEVAGLAAEDIGYVEAHGTGTVLGDQVELAALAEVYGAATPGCAIGAVKPNVGHTDTAAGVVGLIKTVLALQQDTVPPVPAQPGDGPDAELGAARFFIPRQARPWSTTVPRRAAVSSFGLGGTNAHVILAPDADGPVAEGPGAAGGPEASDEPRVAVVTAATPQALRDRALDLATWLDGPGADTGLGDVLGTLWHGRRHLAHRTAIALPPDPEQAHAALRKGLREVAEGADLPPARPEPAVAVLLPGQGVRLSAADAPADRDPAFAADLTRLQDAVLRAGGPDLRDFRTWDGDDPRLLDTAVVQPLLFTLGLAHLWWLERRGIRPDTLLGHSIGELTAAAYAGVFDVEDAAAAVVRRGALMGEAPPGAMLAVPLDEAAARAITAGLPADLCGVNGPDAVVLGGDPDTVAEIERRCAERGLATTRLATSHAFHTRSMEQAAARFEEFLRALPLSAPRTKVISNVSGAELTPEQATDPGYWAAQLRATVRLADGVRTLLAGPCDVVVGVGGSRSLTNPVRRAARDLGTARPPRIVDMLGGTGQDVTLARHTALAQLWAAGCAVDLAPPRPDRIAPLPRYPFADTRHWIDAPDTPSDNAGDTPPGAQETDPPAPGNTPAVPAAQPAPEASEIATVITEIWQDAFGGAPLAPEDNFFTLGGSSLQAAQLISVINDTLLLALVLGDLYEHSDLAAFIHRAEELAGERDDEELLRLLNEIEEVP
ncbi:type I polyketide synthase [Streptomyces alboniger]|uniref:Acyltransferase domain-containing protein n=1 Tax=Streptomyces alboniger TaxID=132473 RepID=A0A5J6HNM8_STRAD|nr:type I polyketide synthase [Streptomyces alboniger]QEV21836.1 acyltransferase domain-containing protein [Streptomyces alboniger]